ncbi:MAG: ferritin [Bacteroidia bacterium]
MIKKEMETLLNEQFHREMFAGMQYLAVCSYFEDKNLDGFANFFRVQAQEEMAHAMKQFDYVHRVDGKITMSALPKPQTEFGTFVEVFEFTLAAEKNVTENINQLMKKAVELGDFATQSFLQWFVTEQVEEEELVRQILQKLRMIGDSGTALYMLNEELKNRKPEPAAGGKGGE